MRHHVLAFFLPVRSGCEEALRTRLDAIGLAVPGRPTGLPFDRIVTLHFASLSILPGFGGVRRLVFECNFDGPIDDFLDAVATTLGPSLLPLLAQCERPPATAAGIPDYLRRHVVFPAAHHVGNTGRSLARIRFEERLREDIVAHLETSGCAEMDAKALLAGIQAKVRSSPQYADVANVPARRTLPEVVLAWSTLVVGAAVLLALFLPATLALLALQWKEERDPVQQDPADPERIRHLEQWEDWIVQNHIASAYVVKPGLFRRLVLGTVLWLVDRLARTVFTKGSLGGIPSIHFAHWSLLDDGRTLVFLSNFDGSWGRYLDDFIDLAASGLTSVWSNTQRFPRTRFLAFRGARDGPRFKAWARDRQEPSRVFYSAYPGLTVAQIDRNSAIREGLFAGLGEEETLAWLRLL